MLKHGKTRNRLASGDRRQAYEAFTLICLLTKARLTDSILEAIVNHSNSRVRVSAVQLLAGTGQEDLFEQLQELAIGSDMDEEVRTALLEAMTNWNKGNRKRKPRLINLLSENRKTNSRLSNQRRLIPNLHQLLILSWHHASMNYKPSPLDDRRLRIA